MACFLRLFQSNSHSYDQGVPVERRSPVRDIPEKHQDAAVALFRKLYTQYRPTSNSIELYKTFKDVAEYFESHITNAPWDQDKIAIHIENELLRELSKVTQKDERQAYKQLQAVIHQLAAHGIPEGEINNEILKYQSDPRGFAKQHPQKFQLLLKYQTARNVYDVAVSHWAKRYLKHWPATRKQFNLLGRFVDVLIQNEKPCWLLRLFGYKSERSAMLELKKKSLQRQQPQSVLHGHAKVHPRGYTEVDFSRARKEPTFVGVAVKDHTS